MNKKILFGSLALISLLTACKNDSEYSYTWPATVTTNNIVTNLSNGATTASAGVYTVSRTVNNNTSYGSIGVVNLEMGTSSPVSFVTLEQPYQTNSNLTYSYFTDVVSANPSVIVSNSRFLFTNNFYWPTFSVFNFKSPGEQLYANYIVNGYQIRTIPSQSMFVGGTLTTYGSQTNTNDEIYYFLDLDIKNNTATVIMFNSKFSASPMEPVKDIRVSGLDVTYNNGVITATGSLLTPDMAEGSAWTPNENYRINSIKFETAEGTYTKCHLNFTVEAYPNNPDRNAIYTGTFSGSSLMGEGLNPAF